MTNQPPNQPGPGYHPVAPPTQGQYAPPSQYPQQGQQSQQGQYAPPSQYPQQSQYPHQQAPQGMPQQYQASYGGAPNPGRSSYSAGPQYHQPPAPVAVTPPSAQYAPAAQQPWAQPGRFRPRRKRRVIFEIILLSLGTLGVLSIVALMAMGMGVGSIVVASILSLIPLAIVGAAVLWVDRWEPEPRLLLAAAFVWGGGISVWLASLMNAPIGSLLGNALAPSMPAEVMPAIFGAPVVEEWWKGLGVLLIFLLRRRQFNGPVDGIVYAAVIAAAFAFVENIQYLGGAGDDVAFTFIMRGLASPFGHLIYTACIGVALGVASRQKSKWAWLWLMPLGYLGAIALHAAWNGFASYTQSLADIAALFVFVNWLPLVVWAIILVWLRKNEVKLVGQRLSEYVPSGWLVPQEVAMLTSLQGRRQAKAWAARGGPAAATAMKKFQKAAVALAYARQDLHTGHVGIRARQDELALLEQIGQTRAQFKAALGV
ncbi:PrsW family intramembrane metalloprotease [Ruania halotolerans]|uniref:PrsW family intramembrane metalloprotease n=1 Tax=Ruania halotolerans TaxID=2897773 RepID=UPI001E363178|nr:PrsW family intramembrane metalloprotease [Ruania halotolerans]UFU05693.1 PrsW family glutamic-type intramembrane protease [Ruania halotolerans]